MLYSKLFGKSVKQEKRDIINTSHSLLYKGGFIRESVAGRYFMLPLGQRVRNKIIDVIRDEMDSSGAQEMLSPTLHPMDLWRETNRDKETGFELMTVEDRRGTEFALGGTAEEMFLDAVRGFRLSYKDLPINIYQFSQKFRDELRARGGLLRVREFTMKDAYSFDINEEEFNKEYQNMWETYSRIFTRLGLETAVVPADVGYIGGKVSHEFVVETASGESKYFTSESGYVAHEDVAEFKRELINPEEELKPFEIIDQPEWVQTMEDNKKHYNLPENRFLKNVVYKNRVTDEFIIAAIRGDLDVNKTKLEAKIGAVGQLEEATDEDLALMNTKRGYVHSWGHERSDGGVVRYVGDLSLKTVVNFIGGQKEETTDSKNVNYGRDFEYDPLIDIALAKNGYLSPDGKSKLEEKKGIEVGNLFNLEYHYSSKMKNATYVDQDGSEKPYYMGSYGIGIERTMAAIVEKYHDDAGITWPEIIAPFAVHMVGLNLEDENIFNKSNKAYEILTKSGIEVLFDDRTGVSAGAKFADVDLIGCPYRVVISAKTGEHIEVKKRTSKESDLMSTQDLIKMLNA
ncbi:proline--tRNA ligase [Patescibacteria group bacterium]